MSGPGSPSSGPAVAIAVVVYPGSNCEHDTVAVLESLGAEASLVWHTTPRLDGFDGAVLPGGFAHGDYLRPGAIARFSPVTAAVVALAESGAPVLGICNGFQVLTEAGLLPGALRRNAGLRFLCETVECVVASNAAVITRDIEVGSTLRLPINHFEGNFTCDAATFSELERQRRVVLRYAATPNGSLGGIAGICNATGNVVGMMPHPERAADELLGAVDGRLLLGSFVGSCSRRRQAAPEVSGPAGVAVSSAGARNAAAGASDSPSAAAATTR